MTTHMPLAPLERLARAKHSTCGEGDFSDNEFARMVGVSNRAVARWRAAGDVIPWTTADKAAIGLGLHPIVIWPKEWADLDAGIYDNTDLKALRACDRAMDKIVLDGPSLSTNTPLERMVGDLVEEGANAEAVA